jgi:hypothetical protein
VLYLTDDPEAVAFIIGNVSRIRAFEVGGGDCAKQRGALNSAPQEGQHDQVRQQSHDERNVSTP